MAELQYTPEEFRSIVQGYRKLDKGGRLSALFREVSLCDRGREHHPDCSDPPVNRLVRPLPLSRLSNGTAVDNYYTRIKRDHGFLRNLLAARLSPSAFRKKVVSERFCMVRCGNAWRCRAVQGDFVVETCR